MYQSILTGIILGICSITDLKNRKVYHCIAAAYLILSLAGHWIGQTASVYDLLLGMIPGLFCFLLSFVSRQSLGYGDSTLITLCGISLGIRSVIEILLAAFFCSGLWALLLFFFGRTGQKKEFPFVPFLFLGVVICLAGGA